MEPVELNEILDRLQELLSVMRLSREPEPHWDENLGPADQLRAKAERMDRRDAVIQRARTVLAKYRPEAARRQAFHARGREPPIKQPR